MLNGSAGHALPHVKLARIRQLNALVVSKEKCFKVPSVKTYAQMEASTVTEFARIAYLIALSALLETVVVSAEAIFTKLSLLLVKKFVHHLLSKILILSSAAIPHAPLVTA